MTKFRQTKSFGSGFFGRMTGLRQCVAAARRAAHDAASMEAFTDRDLHDIGLWRERDADCRVRLFR